MPYEILPHLYLGDANDAIHLTINTKCIVNCTKDIPFYSTDVQQIRIPVDDNGYETDLLVNYWTPEMVGIITNHIMQEHDVLIHCQMGRQRSAATVAAFIMKTMDWPLDKTINHIKQKKRDAFFPEVNFMKSLEMYTLKFMDSACMQKKVT